MGSFEKSLLKRKRPMTEYEKNDLNVKFQIAHQIAMAGNMIANSIGFSAAALIKAAGILNPATDQITTRVSLESIIDKYLVTPEKLEAMAKKAEEERQAQNASIQ